MERPVSKNKQERKQTTKRKNKQTNKDGSAKHSVCLFPRQQGETGSVPDQTSTKLIS